MTFKSINPATNEVIATYEETNSATTTQILDATHAAFLHWRQTPFVERLRLVKNMAQVLRTRKIELARLMTLEMGKPIQQSEGEIEKCAWNCEFYAEHAEAFLKDELIATTAKKSFVTYRPLGVILAVMPWNFPFWQVFRFLAPTLMAGNAAVLKHASNVSGSALAIESVVREAGLPENIFRTLLVPSSRVADIIAHPHIAAITLTGSTTVGRSVAAIAGAALKKCVLELGGSDPYVILEDANLEQAATACVQSRTLNTGQSCIAAKRIIVVEEIYAAFEKLFVEKMQALQFGDPLDPKIHLGPLARKDLRDELHRQVQESTRRGAKLLLGGAVPECRGSYYPATVLAGVKPGMPAYDEELFGPVAALIRVKTEADAIRVANDSPYGLGGAVFTRNLTRGEKIAAMQIDAGNVFVNDFVKSDPRLPFGGIKESGFGRELGVFGIREFVNIKTVWIMDAVKNKS